MVLLHSWPIEFLVEKVLEVSVAQNLGDQHDLDFWPTDLNISRDHLLINDYLLTKFEASVAKRSWVNPPPLIAQGVGDRNDSWSLTYRPVNQKVSFKFEASGSMYSWVIRCTKWRDTDQHTCTYMCKAYAPPLYWQITLLTELIFTAIFPIFQSHSFHEARWEGKCKLPPDVQRKYMLKNKTDSSEQMIMEGMQDLSTKWC